MLGLAINGVGVLVLVAVLVYAWRLDRKLKDLEKNRLDIQKSLTDFTNATSRAERAIQQLRETAQEVDGSVEGQLSRAVGLRDELNFLIDAADKIANRITTQTQEAQAKAQHLRDKAPAAEKEKPRSVKPVITTKGESTFKPIEIEKASPPASKKIFAEKEEDKKLPAWLKPADKNATTVKPATPPAPTVPPETQTASGAQGKPKRQSEAEQELQQALENMR